MIYNPFCPLFSKLLAKLNMQIQRIQKVKLIINGLYEEKISFNGYTRAPKLAISQREAWSLLFVLNNGEPDLLSEGDEVYQVSQVEWALDKDKALRSSIRTLGLSSCTKITKE